MQDASSFTVNKLPSVGALISSALRLYGGRIKLRVQAALFPILFAILLTIISRVVLFNLEDFGAGPLLDLGLSFNFL